MSPAREAYQLRISIDGIEPSVWRRVLVDGRTTLQQLHRIIQLLFNWEDQHRYEFTIGARQFEAPDPEADYESSAEYCLSDVVEEGGTRFTYLYDPGDDWAHTIAVERVTSGADVEFLPVLLGGERNGPPEDSGGSERYQTLQWLSTRPLSDLDAEERELVEWLGPDFHPDEFSLSQARHALLLLGAWGLLAEGSAEAEYD